MTSFTPGPWRFQVYAMHDDDVERAKQVGIEPTRLLTNDGMATVSAPADDGPKPVARIVCHTPYKRGTGYKVDCAERDANAHLIAAAPDMYQALKDLVSADRDTLNDDASPIWGQIAAALAKAEGR